MNKKELVKAVAEKAEMTQKLAGEVVDAVLETITDELVDGGEVSLTGFGKFSVTERAEREGRNPSTGEPMMIPASNSVKFKASSNLKDAVNA